MAERAMSSRDADGAEPPCPVWVTNAFAVLVPTAYLALVVYLIYGMSTKGTDGGLQGGDAAALVGGIAAMTIFLATFAENRKTFLERLPRSPRSMSAWSTPGLSGSAAGHCEHRSRLAARALALVGRPGASEVHSSRAGSAAALTGQGRTLAVVARLDPSAVRCQASGRGHARSARERNRRSCMPRVREAHAKC
ncbi:hypothetical protein KM427_04235 [Nocardioides sp. LMS-CY]|uniref:hypothetical protein n=1 Tax=Nocardioides sp. (strain LMS-CY) TaxID=2840457 RepID=UPI001BFFEE6B|nr:hypothetical protein [Nocardioides sp. LMS-CY]QWF22951.1 hypothetical protein KM427_04235 [Nocardioides sp. LMS-CY]